MYDLFSKTKSYKITIPPVNMTMIAIFYYIIIILGDSVMFVGSKLGYEVLDVFGVDAKFVECRSDEYSILYGKH